MRAGLSFLLAVCLCVCAASLKAEVVEIQKVRVDVPSGWSVNPSTAKSIRLKSPDGKIDITVYIQAAAAAKDGDLLQLAHRVLEAEFAAQKRFAKENGITISHHKSWVTGDSELSFTHSILGFSSGVELCGVTMLERGRAISVGGESREATQSDLQKAVQLILGRIRE